MNLNESGQFKISEKSKLLKYWFRRQELTTEKVKEVLLLLFITMGITHSSIYVSSDKSIKQHKFEFVFKENH